LEIQQMPSRLLLGTGHCESEGRESPSFDPPWYASTAANCHASGDGHRGIRSAAGEPELPHLDVARATKAWRLEEGFCTIWQCVKTDVVVGFTYFGTAFDS
jgi:hypothetical protein